MIRTVTGDDDNLRCSIQTARLSDNNIQSLILYLERPFGKGNRDYDHLHGLYTKR